MSKSIMPSRSTFAAFSFVPGRSPQAEDPGVDKNGNAVRRRRHHAKSKLGCMTCKRRRVRCDQSRPGCSNCAGRNLECHYYVDSQQERRQVATGVERGAIFLTDKADKSPEKPCSSHPDGLASKYVETSLADPAIDLDNTCLLHHFQTSTCNSMLFGPDFWRIKVMPLALRNRYLMHGVLLMASAHLRYLHPNSQSYSDAEVHHLALTLSGFRDALSGTLSGENADVVTACSVILLHHAWTVAYSAEGSLNLHTSVDIGADNMIAFSAGLRSVLQSVWHVREKSIFKDIINPRMVNGFKAWAITESYPCKLEEIFIGHSRLAWPNAGDGERACLGLDYASMDTIDRLTPVMRAADFMRRGASLTYLLTEISPYLLMWLGKCSDAFQKDVKGNDEEALLMLLCFYLCTLSLLSKDNWWVRDRSKFMIEAISERLRKNHNECGERAAFICNYFGVESRKFNLVDD